MKIETPNTVTPKNPDDWMTCRQVLDELNVSRSTLDKWRTEKRFPEFVRLPNGELRIRRSILNAWFESLQKVA